VSNFLVFFTTHVVLAVDYSTCYVLFVLEKLILDSFLI